MLSTSLQPFLEAELAYRHELHTAPQPQHDLPRRRRRHWPTLSRSRSAKAPRPAVGH